MRCIIANIKGCAAHGAVGNVDPASEAVIATLLIGVRISLYLGVD